MSTTFKPTIGRVLRVAGVIAFGSALLAIPLSAAKKPDAKLEQCANGGPTCDTANPSRWITGNLGTHNSVYSEGDSVPYRAVLGNLGIGETYMVEIEWDSTQSGKHAIDYLTTYNRTVATASPCA